MKTRVRRKPAGQLFPFTPHQLADTVLLFGLATEQALTPGRTIRLQSQ